MARRQCERQFEVLECATNGAPGAELRAHIAACESCRELFDVAHSIAGDRATLMGTAHLPSAGLVFWRANMRAQREVARTAVRAGSLIQFALLITAVIAGVAIAGVSIDVHSAAKWILAAAQTWAVPLVALVAWLILAPVAVYFAVTEK